MKNMSCILVIIFLYATSSSIYDIQLEKINGTDIQMSEYANRKIIVIPFNAASPDTARLHYLDSLQIADTSLQVIAVPATDFSGESSNAALNSLSSLFSPKLVITKQAAVKKEATVYQQILFKWLTHVNENGHFDLDVTGVDQLFIVSKTGVLYSVLDNDVPNDILSQVLNQTVNQ